VVMLSMSRVRWMRCIRCGRVQKIRSRDYNLKPRCMYCGGSLEKFKFESMKQNQKVDETKLVQVRFMEE